MLHLVTEKPVDPILEQAKRLGRYDAVFPRIRSYALQAKHGVTDLERTMAAGMLVEMVLAAAEVVDHE